MLTILAAASVFRAASAQTSLGLEPTTTTQLNVTFGAVLINPAGIMVPQSGKIHTLASRYLTFQDRSILSRTKLS